MDDIHVTCPRGSLRWTRSIRCPVRVITVLIIRGLCWLCDFHLSVGGNLSVSQEPGKGQGATYSYRLQLLKGFHLIDLAKLWPVKVPNSGVDGGW